MVFNKNKLIAVVSVVFLAIAVLMVMVFVKMVEADGTSRSNNLLQKPAETEFTGIEEERGTAETTAAAVSAPAVTAAQQAGGGYSEGYSAGYAAGVQDGNNELSSVKDLERAAYEKGYAAGSAAAGQSGSEGEAAGESSAVQVVIGGSFTAAVRAVLPDYETDDTVLQAAVIQFPGEGMFVMKISPEVCSLLTAGETYTFLIDEQTLSVSTREYLLEDNVLSADILKKQYIAVGSVRAPRDSETGSHSARLTYKYAENDNKGETT